MRCPPPLMRFFRPDAVRITLLAVFLFIAFLGWRESGAFSDHGDAPATGFWTLWMALLAPLGLLLLLFRKAGVTIDLFHAAPVVFWAVQIIYLYAMGCAIASIAGAVSRKIASVARR